jgi:hypothetical protein
MAICEPQTAPPASQLYDDIQDISRATGDDARKLFESALKAASSMNRIVGGRELLQPKLSALSYTPELFKKMRELKKGFDGHGSEPPDSKLIDQAEALWTNVRQLFPAYAKPAVFPGADNFISFSWRNTNKRLELAIHYNPSDVSFTCDWVINFNDESDSYEGEFDLDLLITIIGRYFQR